MYILTCFFISVSNFSLYHIVDTPSNKEDNSIGYFNHFRKGFFKTYGLAHHPLAYDDTTLYRRLNTYSCEFYLRPQVGTFEFFETLLQNIDYLENNADILGMTSLNDFINKTRKIEHYLRILNSMKEETVMFRRINVLNIMLTFTVCTSYKC